MSAISYQEYVLRIGKALRAQDAPPTSLSAWQTRAKSLREKILEAIGPNPEDRCGLDSQIIGEVKRLSYVIERVVFQTRPDVWCTANVYRPDPAPNRGPAVLVVHGHWRLARLQNEVQSRCIGLAKLGFFVLAIDSFGAGERYSYPGPGTYHGSLYGATLWPVGLTLLGAQLFDNRRAVDYLASRPEVDPGRIGVTGESGGGNQSMYAGAFDDRIRAVVPVCSVGNYIANLSAACCVCEVLPRALTICDEGDILGLVAPRPLLVVSAKRDSQQFSPAAATLSLNRARTIYNLLGARDQLRHDVFDAGHGYDRPMREAMYGWMTRWLKNEGKGAAIPEPEFALEDPRDLACFPDADTRPATWLFPPTLAKRIGEKQLQRSFPSIPKHAEEWESALTVLRAELRRCLGDMPPPARLIAKVGPAAGPVSHQSVTVTLSPEPDLPLVVHSERSNASAPSCILLHLDGAEAGRQTDVAKAMRTANWNLFTPELRATQLAKLANRPADHDAAEHGLWIGRPLLGQWVFEAQTLLDWLAIQPMDRRKIYVAGVGSAALIALVVAALDPDRSAGAILSNSPTTYLSDAAYGGGWKIGAIVPGIMRAGDICHIAAAITPRRLVIADGLDPQGALLTERNLKAAFDFTSRIYQLCRAADRLILTTEPRWSDILRILS